MDKTEKNVYAIPSAAELEQLSELHKAMGDHMEIDKGVVVHGTGKINGI